MATQTQNFDSTIDRGIERKIAAALKMRQVPSLRNIRIDSHRGSVTLRGQVYSVYEKHLGYQSALGVEGVGAVVNRLEVVDAPDGYGRKKLRVAGAVAGGLAIFIASGLTLWAACADRSGHPPVFPVTGKVLVDGQPAPGAMVVCYPKSDLAGGPRPKGSVGKDGTFQLTTFDANDGAPAGLYLVTVEWPHAIGKGDDTRYVNAVAVEYASPVTTKLAMTVDEQSSHQVRLAVRGAGRAGVARRETR